MFSAMVDVLFYCVRMFSRLGWGLGGLPAGVEQTSDATRVRQAAPQLGSGAEDRESNRTATRLEEEPTACEGKPGAPHPSPRTAPGPRQGPQGASGAEPGADPPVAAGETAAPGQSPRRAAIAIARTGTGRAGSSDDRRRAGSVVAFPRYWPAADPNAMSDVRAASAAPSPRGDSKVTDEPRPAAARVAETIRRAVKAVLGRPAMNRCGRRGSRGCGGARRDAGRSGPDRGRAAAGTAAAPAPSFDVVRVGRDGRAVIAGRAEPGAEVELARRAGDRSGARQPARRLGRATASRSLRAISS